MSDKTGNPTELFSVKGMVALVCRCLEVIFSYQFTSMRCDGFAATLCNDSESGSQSAAWKPPTPLWHLLTRFLIDRSQVEEQVLNLPFRLDFVQYANIAQGIGLMMARALANAGAAKVYIAGRRLEVLESAAKTINKPDVVVPLTCDVTSQDSLTALVSEIDKRSGYLNLLVCNSGIGGPQVPYPSEETSLQEFREKTLAIPMDEYNKTFSVNVTAVWYTAMAFLELLDKGNKKGNLDWQGQVLVTSSIAGFNKRAPGGWAYGQSKAAATHSAKQLAGVLPKWGIR